MTAVHRHIQSLETYVERNGARLVRVALPEWVHGRVFRDLITLQADLTPEQELLTLVHELAHWLAHRDAAFHSDGAHRTIFEYEAEAVEALVMDRLGLPRAGHGAIDPDEEMPTDGLLSSSVVRVISTAQCICHALGLEHCEMLRDAILHPPRDSGR
jgi:hypothetical protein